MKNQVNYSPDETGGGTTSLPPITPYAHINLENTGGDIETVQLIINIPVGSMLDINGLQISGLLQTTCGCSYRKCTLGMTVTQGIDVLTPFTLPIAKNLLTGAQLIMIEISDNNPAGRPKGRAVVIRAGSITITI